MTRFDITWAKIILIGGGLILVFAGLLLAVDLWIVGEEPMTRLWIRIPVILAGLAVVLVTLATKRKDEWDE